MKLQPVITQIEKRIAKRGLQTKVFVSDANKITTKAGINYYYTLSITDKVDIMETLSLITSIKKINRVTKIKSGTAGLYQPKGFIKVLVYFTPLFNS